VILLAGIAKPDVFAGAVVRVQFVTTRVTAELRAVAVRLRREPALRATLARTVWRDGFDPDAALQCLVLDILDESAKGPDVMPLGVWQPVADAVKFLEHDCVAVGLDGFSYQIVRYRMEVLFAPGFLAFAEAKHGVVRGLRAALLERRAPFLELGFDS
jgi:hypothetical protein